MFRHRLDRRRSRHPGRCRAQASPADAASTTQAPTAALPAVSANSAASSTSTAGAALAGAVAHPDAAEGPVTSPAAAIAAAVPAASALSNDPFDLSLPDAAAGAAASTAAAAVPAAAAAAAQAAAPASPAAAARRAGDLDRRRANLSDGDTEASTLTASANAVRGARRSNRSGGRQHDLTKVSEKVTPLRIP